MKITVLLLLILQTLWTSYLMVCASTATKKTFFAAVWAVAWLLLIAPSAAAFAYIIAT